MIVKLSVAINFFRNYTFFFISAVKKKGQTKQNKTKQQKQKQKTKTENKQKQKTKPRNA